MADLDQIVDFGALADEGLAETGAVDGGIGADFDVIADLDDADLVDFDVAPVHQLVAVAIGTDDGAGLQNDPVAQHATFAHGDIGHDVAVPADDASVADDAVRADFGAIADRGTRHDDGTGMDADFFRIEHGRGIDRGLRMDARSQLAGGGGKMADDHRKRQRRDCPRR